MTNEIASTDKTHDDVFFEYQGFDRFFQQVRGRIKASTLHQAKALLKSQAVYLPQLWPAMTGPTWSPHSLASVLKPHLFLRSKNDDRVRYSRHTLSNYLYGIILLAIGAGTVWLSLRNLFPLGCTSERIEPFPFCLGSLLALLSGVAFLGVGLTGMALNLTLTVDRNRQLLTRQASLFFWRWSQTIPASHITRILLHGAVFYSGSGHDYRCILSLEVNQAALPLYSSADKEDVLDKALTISEYLRIPVHHDFPTA